MAAEIGRRLPLAEDAVDNALAQLHACACPGNGSPYGSEHCSHVVEAFAILDRAKTTRFPEGG